MVVCVSDHGPGISPVDRPHIFERARRLGTVVANGGGSGGVGIGLSIAKAFTEAHGSSIWLESPADGGARFCFSMPVAAEALLDTAEREGLPVRAGQQTRAVQEID